MTAVAISAVTVHVNGRVWPPEAARVLSVRMSSRLGQPAQCELSLGDTSGAGGAGGAGMWSTVGRLGDSIEVTVEGDREPLFLGEVTCVELLRGEGVVTTRVRGYDLLHRLRKHQQPRVFTDVTARDLAVALVADLGLTVVAERNGPRLERVVQHRQDDLALLVEVAFGAGLYPTVRGRTLHLVALSGYGDPVKLDYGQSLWEARVEANLDRVAGRLTAIGWQAQRAEVITGRATAAELNRSIGFDRDALADRVDGEATLVDQPASSEDAMTSLAQAVLDVSAGRAVTLHGVAAGSAALRAGTPVEVHGLDDELDGGYVITSAVHTIDGAGYHTTFSTEPPQPPETPSSCSVTLGLVRDVDDPDRLGRVRVTLPALGDLDVGWLGLLCPGAGAGKGLVILPSPGDTVVVVLPHQSPAEGVVLGSVYGRVAPPDAGVSGGSVSRWTLRTTDGQSIVVDDEKHRIRVEDRAGSFVELAPDVVRLHAATDLMIDAPGHAMTIRAASIDFEHAATSITL